MNKIKKLKAYIGEMFENVKFKFKFKFTCAKEAHRVKKLYLEELRNPSEHNSVYPRLGGIEPEASEDIQIEYAKILQHIIAVSKTMDGVYAKLTAQGISDEQFTSAMTTNFTYRGEDKIILECREYIIKAMDVLNEQISTTRNTEAQSAINNIKQAFTNINNKQPRLRYDEDFKSYCV